MGKRVNIWAKSAINRGIVVVVGKHRQCRGRQERLCYTNVQHPTYHGIDDIGNKGRSFSKNGCFVVAPSAKDPLRNHNNDYNFFLLFLVPLNVHTSSWIRIMHWSTALCFLSLFLNRSVFLIAVKVRVQMSTGPKLQKKVAKSLYCKKNRKIETKRTHEN